MVAPGGRAASVGNRRVDRCDRTGRAIAQCAAVRGDFCAAAASAARLFSKPSSAFSKSSKSRTCGQPAGLLLGQLLQPGRQLRRRTRVLDQLADAHQLAVEGRAVGREARRHLLQPAQHRHGGALDRLHLELRQGAVLRRLDEVELGRSTVRQRCDGTEPIADSASASIDLKPVPSQAETASADFRRFCNAGISSSSSSIANRRRRRRSSVFSALSMRARIADCSANIIFVSAGSPILPTSSSAPASAALTLALSSTRRLAQKVSAGALFHGLDQRLAGLHQAEQRLGRRRRRVALGRRRPWP